MPQCWELLEPSQGKTMFHVESLVELLFNSFLLNKRLRGHDSEFFELCLSVFGQPRAIDCPYQWFDFGWAPGLGVLYWLDVWGGNLWIFFPIAPRWSGSDGLTSAGLSSRFGCALLVRRLRGQFVNFFLKLPVVGGFASLMWCVARPRYISPLPWFIFCLFLIAIRHVRRSQGLSSVTLQKKIIKFRWIDFGKNLMTV